MAPGGGSRELVFDAEGQATRRVSVPARRGRFFCAQIPAARRGGLALHARRRRADAYRAVRLVRSRAKAWGIGPKRVGMLGFSAGGDRVGMVAYAPGKGDANARDPIDRLDGRPDFQMLVYPAGKVPRREPERRAPRLLAWPRTMNRAATTPRSSSTRRCTPRGVPVEARFLAGGKHAFNRGDRSSPISVTTWPERVAAWLRDSGYLTPTAAPAGVPQ